MRRTLVAVVVALAATVTVAPAVPSAATDGSSTPAPVAEPTPTGRAAEESLATASRLLERGSARGGAEGGAHDEGTLVMRDLFMALPRLDVEDRQRARELLARPTDGANDRSGLGYTAPSRRRCSDRFCVHYVTSTADAPPNRRWVKQNLATLDKIWRFEVGRLSFRRPVSDRILGPGRDGGNGKVDVYLKDLAPLGLYGVCIPEASRPGRANRWEATGYCVLDNDYARSQYATSPRKIFRATAAHEFFHLVQLAYDYSEDGWLVESTATWMEERFADDVDDNRQYLPVSQVRVPWQPLDVTSSNYNQYGNWAFWEYLTRRHGVGIVKAMWQRTAPEGGRNTYSTKNLRRLLDARGDFARTYHAFAAANLNPGRTYPEGRTWPEPVVAGAVKLGKKTRAQRARVLVDHLAAQHLRVRPERNLQGRRWALRVRVDGPRRSVAPGVVLTVKRRSGAVSTVPVRLDRRGRGKATVRSSRSSVRHATVTMVNASTRFARCYSHDPNERPVFSCLGDPVHDAQAFALRLAVRKR